MIIKQGVGSHFRGVLAYALQPHKQPRVIGGSAGGAHLGIDELTRRFEFTRTLRPSLGRCVHHAAFAFKPGSALEDALLKTLAREYLKRWAGTQGSAAGSWYAMATQSILMRI